MRFENGCQRLTVVLNALWLSKPHRSPSSFELFILLDARPGGKLKQFAVP
jgi:hypothetical protein